MTITLVALATCVAGGALLAFGDRDCRAPGIILLVSGWIVLALRWAMMP